MGDLTESSTPPPRQPPFREDCWTEDATSTLVDAWGRRYLDLNRGNLRQKDWLEVADAVNSQHGHTKKTRRTDVQCKNRIDTLKKKYKVEKARISGSNGTLTSSWRFFPQLELLIGPNSNKHHGGKLTPSGLPLPPMAVPISFRRPVGTSPVVLPMKRPSLQESHFKKNYLAMAAAAAAASEDEDEEDDEVEREEVKGGAAAEEEAEAVEEDGEEGMRRLARAIERFGEIFEKVESMKYRQMLELEKQRMQFAKDLEVQRMQLFMDTQVQLEKIKHAKRPRSSDGIIYGVLPSYSCYFLRFCS